MSQANDEMELIQMRKRIIEAASDLYEKKGRDTSVEEIARAAGISVPVTYQFVKKAADIMRLIMEDWQRDFHQRVQPILESDLTPERKLAQVVASYYRTIDQQRSKVMMVYRASRQLDREGRRHIMGLEMEAVRLFQGILDQGVAAGVFRVDDTLLAAYDIVMLGHMWSLKSWHFKQRAMDLEDFIDAQLELILAMVGVRG
jgi:AcrR family transcriptional regulator